jgi:transposase
VNIHKNAKTTPKMRALIVERRQAGEAPRAIASAVGVSPVTVSKWLRRFRNEGVAGLQDRTSRPHRLRTRITSEQTLKIETLRRARQPFWKIAREAGLSRATVARIAKAKGLSRLSALDQRIEIIRYEKKQPGEMIHIDIKSSAASKGPDIASRETVLDRVRHAAARKAEKAGNISIWPSMITPGWPILKSCQMKHGAPAGNSSCKPCASFAITASRSFAS